MHPNLTLPQSIAKDKQSQTGEGVLNFHLGRGVQPKESKMRDCRTDRPGHQIWGLAELIFFFFFFFFFFLTNMLLSELIFGPNKAQVKLTELGFGQFLGLGTENLPN